MKDITKLLEAMNDCETEIGEDCGYRDTLGFAQFLQSELGLSFTDEQLKECEDPIMAYFDVVDLLVDSQEDEDKILETLQKHLPNIDLSKYGIGLDAKLTAFYWSISDSKSDEEFEEFVKSFNVDEEDK